MALSLSSGLAAVPQPTPPMSSLVKIEQTAKGWKLMRNGAPYFAKGACVWGENVKMDELKAAGANSVRTYSSKFARWTLDAAQARGMTVFLGYEVSGEHGFSYLNETDVNAQRERFRAFVKRYKDHPALLIWGIGNEVEQGIENPDHLEPMWKELNQLARICKDIDPSHPTAIVLAAPKPEKLAAVRQWCPDVDLVCFNIYGSLRNIKEHLDQQNWQKPYMVTEFGAYGWWEAEQTPWDAPIEQTSTEKAREYLLSYQRGIEHDKARCLGSYVFFWQPKQEATATWFGMFLESGNRLEAVDAMTKAWTGKYPADRCPQIKSLSFVNNKNRYLPGEPIQVKVAASDPEHDPLGIAWRISEEAPPFTTGNSYEIAPRILSERLVTYLPDGAEFAAPNQPGAYRVFVYLYDGHGAATGNLCFHVDKPQLPPPPVAAQANPAPAQEACPDPVAHATPLPAPETPAAPAPLAAIVAPGQN